MVGPSGGGKSTLCQLIPRFYDVTEGRGPVGRRGRARIRQHSLRRAIGIVQQDVFLFADTIRENIRYGRPDATDEEVEQAARQAEIYDGHLAMPRRVRHLCGRAGRAAVRRAEAARGHCPHFPEKSARPDSG